MSDVAANIPNSDIPAPAARVKASFCRQIVDSLVSLILAVVIFRSFVMEGYMIPTGSMAPSLLGHHSRITCPSCRYQFAVGVSSGNGTGAGPSQAAYSKHATDTSDGRGRRKRNANRRGAANCPNCGRRSIDLSSDPPNYGDQLLVHKNAYDFRTPKRWETTVFRNPNDSRQAYVKRVVGLPGEQLQIIDGDVHINGAIQRKDLRTQRQMRICLYDSDHRPKDDPNWRPRWIAQPTETAWTRLGNGFSFDHPAGAGTGNEAEWGWVTYRHWIRSGGLHKTVVQLGQTPLAPLPDTLLSPVRFDEKSRQLNCTGALSSKWRDRLIRANPDPDFALALQELYERSHLAPITDRYGYNLSRHGVRPATVRDLMLSAKLTIRGGRGQFVIRMDDGRSTCDFVIDTADKLLKLLVDGEGPVRSAPLPDEFRGQPLRLETSLMDAQFLAAVNGRQVFEAWNSPTAELSERQPKSPVRFGARGLAADVNSLKLYRDVYYTHSRAHNGADEPFVLGDDEYFMLGDNSPVSSDSRCWPNGAVSARLLMGKPLVLHLPSRPGKLRIGGKVRYIRIPDFSRIRYIH